MQSQENLKILVAIKVKELTISLNEQPARQLATHEQYTKDSNNLWKMDGVAHLSLMIKRSTQQANSLVPSIQVKKIVILLESANANKRNRKRKTLDRNRTAISSQERRENVKQLTAAMLIISQSLFQVFQLKWQSTKGRNPLIKVTPLPSKSSFGENQPSLFV